MAEPPPTVKLLDICDKGLIELVTPLLAYINKSADVLPQDASFDDCVAAKKLVDSTSIEIIGAFARLSNAIKKCAEVSLRQRQKELNDAAEILGLVKQIQHDDRKMAEQIGREPVIVKPSVSVPVPRRWADSDSEPATPTPKWKDITGLMRRDGNISPTRPTPSAAPPAKPIAPPLAKPKAPPPVGKQIVTIKIQSHAKFGLMIAISGRSTAGEPFKITLGGVQMVDRSGSLESHDNGMPCLRNMFCHNHDGKCPMKGHPANPHIIAPSYLFGRIKQFMDFEGEDAIAVGRLRCVATMIMLLDNPNRNFEASNISASFTFTNEACASDGQAIDDMNAAIAGNSPTAPKMTIARLMRRILAASRFFSNLESSDFERSKQYHDNRRR